MLSETDTVSLSTQFIFESRAYERCRATKQVQRTGLAGDTFSRHGKCKYIDAGLLEGGRCGADRTGRAGQLATVITLPLLQWIREAILLRHSCVRACVWSSLTRVVPGGRPSHVQSSDRQQRQLISTDDRLVSDARPPSASDRHNQLAMPCCMPQSINKILISLQLDSALLPWCISTCQNSNLQRTERKEISVCNEQTIVS